MSRLRTSFRLSLENKRLALLQMDLMVRDDNVPSGWIFGTYQYNGKLAQANKWENLAPLAMGE